RELRDRDVIRRPVRAFRSEGQHDVGLYAPDVRGDVGDRGTRIGAVEMLIVIVEHGDVSKAEHAGCAAKLALADGRQGRRAGMLRVSWRMAAVTATLTARSR